MGRHSRRDVSVNAACASYECADANKCYAPAEYHVPNIKNANVKDGQASWESLSGDDGAWCNLPLLMTIIQADMTANGDPNLKRGVL
jgi:hypothetical protein